MDHQGGEVRVVSAAVLAQLQAAGFQVQFLSQISLISLLFFLIFVNTHYQIYDLHFFLYIKKNNLIIFCTITKK